MMFEMKAKSSLVALVYLCLGSGCIFVVEEEEGSGGDDGSGGTGGPSATTGRETGGPATTAGGSDDGSTTSEPTACGEELEGENLLSDPGFEAGLETPWDHHSNAFDSVLCDSGCVTEGQESSVWPRSGEWWAWFGGLTQPIAESAYVRQTITIPAADVGSLSFYFWIAGAAGTGDDVFRVKIDDDVLEEWTDADIDDMSDYERYVFDVSEYADGAEHEIRFEAVFPGTGARTNFFVDDIDVIVCNAATSGSSSDDGSGSASEDSGSGSEDTGTESSSDGTDTGDTTGETTSG